MNGNVTETPVTTTSGSGSVVILVEFLTVADHPRGFRRGRRLARGR
jgi:hypothetical protein